MKVTAIIPDELVDEIQALTHEKTLTASLIKALQEWAELQRIRAITRVVKKKPLRFQDGFSAESVRKLNRR